MASFLEHGGNRFGRNAVPDTQAEGHKQVLDALAEAGNLKIRADLATSDFCAIAAPLCQAAPIFRKRIAVTQVIDARNRGAGGAGPDRGLRRRILLGLPAGGEPTLTQLVVMRSVWRAKP